jgi:hypothetical protein
VPDELNAARIVLEHMGTEASPVSPWTAQVADDVQEWAVSFRLIRSEAARIRFRETAPAELAGRVYATAVDADRLKTATAWIGWLFLIDDQLDEGATGKEPGLARERLGPFGTMAARMAAEPVSGEPPGAQPPEAAPPLLAALADIWRRISVHMPAPWRAVFARHFSDYLAGCEWEAANRARGRVPAEAEFLSRRRDAGAIWPSLDLLEFTADAPITGELGGHPLLAEARTACADVVCWTDDLLTARKERAHGDLHNLAFVLEQATGCAPRTALEMVARRIEDRLGEFRDLRRRILAADTGANARYELYCHLEGLEHWMRGHLEWGLRTIRYGTDTVASADYLEDLLD